eukprot:CAMPEP_0177623980 /NCGR_PEP_ID=MMETSP0419_2-20121207/29213_1 /TAXON_ID=582737 /ORGANISM="Tetraselmis sp., Strain GSL018" /LENGTH=70 /DNA_ID=CAMNT_0019124611 /DNA_START=162 /DNA_END=375 /DNA_ORIENTATION=+
MAPEAGNAGKERKGGIAQGESNSAEGPPLRKRAMQGKSGRGECFQGESDSAEGPPLRKRRYASTEVETGG